MATVEDLNKLEREPISNMTPKQLEYQRKSMCMALVMHVVKARGDETPNDYDLEHYEFFVNATEQMIKDNQLGHTLQAYTETPENGRHLRADFKAQAEGDAERRRKAEAAEAQRKVDEASAVLKRSADTEVMPIEVEEIQSPQVTG